MTELGGSIEECNKKQNTLAKSATPTKSFRSRKALGEEIESLKAAGKEFQVKRSTVEGYRYDLFVKDPLIEEKKAVKENYCKFDNSISHFNDVEVVVDGIKYKAKGTCSASGEVSA